MAAEPVQRHAQCPTAASARRRILMTADTIGGVWRYALELARERIARGEEVVLATMGALPDRAQRAEAAAIGGLVLHASAYRLIWMERPWRDVEAAGDWLLRLAERERPDLVHLNDLGHGTLAWPAPVLTVAHSCVLSWWEAVHGAAAPRAWTRYAARVAAGLRASDCVVAPSAAMLDALRRHYGALPDAHVIGNGCSAPAEPGRKDRYVFAAGRIWDRGKNLGALAAAAGALPWPVCIAGDDRLDGAPPVRLDEVCLLGRLDRAGMRRWLARAAIYALPARYEPFGLSVLEAALAGCALVLGDIPSLRETWDGAALFVAPDDPDALAAALSRLIGDDLLRFDLALRARRRAARYTPAAMADAYGCLYDRLGAGGMRRTAGAPR